MTHHFTDMSSQHSNLEKGMENSDHMKQIGATSGIDLIFENKSIMSEVNWKSVETDWKSDVFRQVESSRFRYKSSTSSRFWVTLVPRGVGLAHQK